MTGDAKYRKQSDIRNREHNHAEVRARVLSKTAEWEKNRQIAIKARKLKLAEIKNKKES